MHLTTSQFSHSYKLVYAPAKSCIHLVNSNVGLTAGKERHRAREAELCVCGLMEFIGAIDIISHQHSPAEIASHFANEGA